MMTHARLRGTGAENLPWQPDPKRPEWFTYRPAPHILIRVEWLPDHGKCWWLCQWALDKYIARESYEGLVQAIRARPVEDFGGVDVIAELEKYR
jgi:hypothetical protein